MPDTPVTAPPFVPVKPLVKVGATGTAVEFECAAEELHVDVNQDDVTTDTFCGSYKSYKPEEWTITATVFPSYGTAGLWNLLRPLVGTTQPFEVRPDGVAPAGPANPSMTGTCRVKAFPFYAGKLGEPTSFDVELAIQGTPTWALTLQALEENFAAATEAAASAPSSGAQLVNGDTHAPETPAEETPAEPTA